MSKWEISKRIDWCMGHAVWTQKLDAEYSVDDCLCCCRPHGHQYSMHVHLESKELNKQGMVLDFKMLNFVKKWIDEVLDHKFMLDFNDPGLKYLVPSIEGVEYIKDGKGLIHDKREYSYVNPNIFKTIEDERLIQIAEGFVFVDFVPTAENLCKWFHKIIQEKLDPLNVKVSQIELFETPKSQSKYFSV
jgi:6-pyruvoyltetrahydropterin/6-carboxytetrahydropterin synthase